MDYLAFCDVFFCVLFVCTYSYDCLENLLSKFFTQHLCRVYETRWEVYRFSHLLARCVAGSVWFVFFLLYTFVFSAFGFPMCLYTLVDLSVSIRCAVVAIAKIPEKSPTNSWSDDGVEECVLADESAEMDVSSGHDTVDQDPRTHADTGRWNCPPLYDPAGNSIDPDDFVLAVYDRLRAFGIIDRNNRIKEIGDSDTTDESDSEYEDRFITQATCSAGTKRYTVSFEADHKNFDQKMDYHYLKVCDFVRAQFAGYEADEEDLAVLPPICDREPYEG